MQSSIHCCKTYFMQFAYTASKKDAASFAASFYDRLFSKKQLFQCFFDSNCTSNGCTNHRVIAHAHEAHQCQYLRGLRLCYAKKLNTSFYLFYKQNAGVYTLYKPDLIVFFSKFHQLIKAGAFGLRLFHCSFSGDSPRFPRRIDFFPIVRELQSGTS